MLEGVDLGRSARAHYRRHRETPARRGQVSTPSSVATCWTRPCSLPSKTSNRVPGGEYQLTDGYARMIGLPEQGGGLYGVVDDERRSIPGTNSATSGKRDARP